MRKGILASRGFVIFQMHMRSNLEGPKMCLFILCERQTAKALPAGDQYNFHVSRFNK